MKKEDVIFGQKILIAATVAKGSIIETDKDDGAKRGRIRTKCNKVGFITGFKKKNLRWDIKFNPGSEIYAIPGVNVNVILKTGYVVEFKERLAGKTQEALLEDVELLQEA
jgi:hypothetical protein